MSIATQDLRAMGFGSLLDAGDALLAKIEGMTTKGTAVTVQDLQTVGTEVAALISQLTEAVAKVGENPAQYATIAADDAVNYLTTLLAGAIKAKTTGSGGTLAVTSANALFASFTTWMNTELAKL